MHLAVITLGNTSSSTIQVKYSKAYNNLQVLVRELHLHQLIKYILMCIVVQLHRFPCYSSVGLMEDCRGEKVKVMQVGREECTQ